jgi:dipeptidyl aminopeptidase/acylaminoacyl peptidase
MFKLAEVPEFHTAAKLYLVTYLSNGFKVKGYLAVPRGDGPFPTIVYCRGGIKNVGMTRLAWVRRFVEHQYVVFAPFYRGNRGGEGKEDFCGEDRLDVTSALHELRRCSLVQEDRIHLFGFSRGAVMALFAAMECSFVRSVVVWGGVSDMALTYEERLDMRRMLKRVIGGTVNKSPEAYKWRTPLHRLREIRCPILIIHGEEDQQVSVRHALLLAQTLEQNNQAYALWTYKNVGHFLSPDLFEETINNMFSWMNDV